MACAEPISSTITSSAIYRWRHGAERSPLRAIRAMVDEVLKLLKTRVNAIGHGLVPLPTLGLRSRRETGLFEL